METVRGGGGDDVIVLGAGHNGLVCACYLAGAGLKVRVLERRGIVGGAAVTEEFLPGFRNSSLSYTVSLLHPRVIAELRLAERGLRIVARPFGNFVPLADGRSLRYGAGLQEDQVEVARFSERDARELPAQLERLARVGRMVREWILRAPPEIGGPAVLSGWESFASAARLMKDFAMLGRQGQRDLIEVFTRSAGEVLDSRFESEPLKAVIGWDSIVGNYASPYAPGSAYVLLHHWLGEVNGRAGAWGHAIGGMGRITELLAQEAVSRGVVIETSRPVKQVVVERGRAVGVETEDGRVLRARAVAAAVNPRLLYERLVDPGNLDEDFRRKVAGYRCGSGSLRINIALSELPDFRAAPGTSAQPHHASGILLGGSLAEMDRAFQDARESGHSRRPIVEMLIPSLVDESLVDRARHPGAHVASLFCQHFDPRPAQGWDALKDGAVQAVFDVVEEHCPNFRRALLGHRAWTPLDLERDFGLLGGDIFHGQLGLDQLFSLRPWVGHARYRGPIEGLYHCASGAHPGGGVTGGPGHNAARRIARDLGR